jgi:hypothetical protein
MRSSGSPPNPDEAMQPHKQANTSSLGLKENSHGYLPWGLDAAALGLALIALIEFIIAAKPHVVFLYEVAESVKAPMIRPEGRDPSHNPIDAMATISALRAIFLLIGAICLLLRNNYFFCLGIAAISILGVVYLPNWLDFPLGLWILLGLVSKETRAAFAEANHPS